ncbi:MAG TPA: acyl-CoA dehydrogenase family protein, partial [Alphaproteobacteria bacterium]
MNRPIARPDKLADSAAAALHAQLDHLLPLVEAEADAAEAQCHLTDKVDAALREAGIYAMLLPKEVGGPELTHFDAMTIVERLSYAHASTGWCVLASVMELAVMAIFIGDEGIKQVFAKGPNVAMAGNGVPRGFAREVEGGYMIRGRWAYGSAIHHADWIHTGCFLTDPNTGETIIGPNDQTKIVITHHPRSTIKLLGNWDVLGLRATGSFDYTIADAEELFVPSALTYTFDTVTPVRGNAQGYLGLPGYSAWAHSGWGLGVGRRILDELVKVIVPRRDVFGMSRDSASFKFQF